MSYYVAKGSHIEVGNEIRLKLLLQLARVHTEYQKRMADEQTLETIRQLLEEKISNYNIGEAQLEALSLEPSEEHQLKATLAWTQTNHDDQSIHLPNKLLVNTATHDDPKLEREVDFYSLFENQQTASSLLLPRCYLCQKEPRMLAIEDPTDQAVPVDIGCGLTNCQLLSVAAALASFHAWCLEHAPLWTGMTETIVEQDQRDSILSGIRWLKDHFADRCDRMDPQQVEQCLNAANAEACQRKIGCVIPIVLRHGQFWNRNLLFRQRSDGTVGDSLLTIINWHTVQPGRLTDDLCQLMAWGVPAEVRRKYEGIVMAYYEKKLKQNVKRPELLPDSDQLWTAYQLTFPRSAFALPFMIRQWTEGGQVAGESEATVQRAVDAYDDALALLAEYGLLTTL